MALGLVPTAKPGHGGRRKKLPGLQSPHQADDLQCRQRDNQSWMQTTIEPKVTCCAFTEVIGRIKLVTARQRYQRRRRKPVATADPFHGCDTSEAVVRMDADQDQMRNAVHNNRYQWH